MEEQKLKNRNPRWFAPNKECPDLPDEIWTLIMSHLSRKDFCRV
jgi:hypothetical protein